MKFTLQIILFFSILNISAQTEETSQEKFTHKLEEFIIDKKTDSTNYFLKQLKESSYKSILEKIVFKKEVSYAEYYRFTSRIGNRRPINYKKVSNYINSFVEEPINKKNIDLDYISIKWTQVSKLRDEGSLNEASKIQTTLDNYVNKFNDSEIEVLTAKTKITTHQIVMYLIQKDIENGKELALKGLETAKKINDKGLQIIFLYHLSDFLIEERKLQEYIDVSEQSLQLDKELPEHSSYYHSTIEHLIDAYIYKGGNNKRVVLLINELYDSKSTRIHTYTLYTKLVSHLEKDSSLINEVFKKFEVNDVPELVSKFQVLGKNLNSNDFFHLVNGSSVALAAHGHYDLALRYKQKAIDLTQKIYSKDLSETLASYKTEQAIKIKEKEITHEKEQTKLYSIIAILAVVLLIISLLVTRKVKRQSKELSEKNKLIQKTLKEKELLVKEVHHRVKNNFQIVSSLLELQTKGIEDEKALELANEGKNRVKSMALIHQKLYQNNTGLVDFDEYIQQLTKELSSLYATKDTVETSVSSKNMMFDVDTAIPLGLIINEIITNSYKYAFRNNRENKLSISISKEANEDYKLVIEDNGPGLSDGFDAKKAKSLGLRLVNRLVKQLHGKLHQTNKNGARFEILFKDNNARQLVN